MSPGTRESGLGAMAGDALAALPGTCGLKGQLTSRLERATFQSAIMQLSVPTSFSLPQRNGHAPGPSVTGWPEIPCPGSTTIAIPAGVIVSSGSAVHADADEAMRLASEAAERGIRRQCSDMMAQSWAAARCRSAGCANRSDCYKGFLVEVQMPTYRCTNDLVIPIEFEKQMVFDLDATAGKEVNTRLRDSLRRRARGGSAGFKPPFPVLHAVVVPKKWAAVASCRTTGAFSFKIPCDCLPTVR